MQPHIQRDIDVSLLRAFLAVIEGGSMTRAALQLNLTQAAVSMQIKRLEALFEKSLFDRNGKTLTLTPIGERLKGYARRMVSLNDEVWGAIVTPEYEGEIILGVPHDIVTVFMPQILKEFHRAWPRLRVRLSCGTTPSLYEALDAGEIDLTLTTEHVPGSITLLPDPLVWVGAPCGEAHLKRPLPISMGSEHCSFRAAALDALAEAGMDWEIVSQYGSMEPAIAAVEADLAVAPFIKQSVPPQLEALTDRSGLPQLPMFYVNLVHSNAERKLGVTELSETIQNGFAKRWSKAA